MGLNSNVHLTVAVLQGVAFKGIAYVSKPVAETVAVRKKYPSNENPRGK